VAISPYIASIRQRIGTGLLLLPAVAVLPIDRDGRILLVRQTDSGRWATIGGTVEPDESPEEAARREAAEEARVVVRLTRLVTAVGGPEYRITYPNGDQVAYVSSVFEAAVESGSPRPDDDETSEVGWFHPREVPTVDLDDLNRHLLRVVLPLLDGRAE
jgi:ADP-ribose pyrophosphatase YjhB (NUDIX family)